MIAFLVLHVSPMTLADPFATVFLGTPIAFVRHAPVAILVHPQTFAVQIVVAMAI